MYVVKLSKEEVEFAIKHPLSTVKKFKVGTNYGNIIVENPTFYENYFDYYCTRYFYHVLKNHMRLIENRLKKEQREYGMANKTPRKRRRYTRASIQTSISLLKNLEKNY